MNIVIPMAGRGSRFADVGFKLPKPMIDVRGMPMYAWAMASLPLALADRVIFVCLSEHLEHTGLADDIRQRYSGLDPEIIALDDVTAGQVCTVLEARALIDNASPLLIYNADTYCKTHLAERLRTLPGTVAGVLGVFEGAGNNWSFVRLDAGDRVVETAEKRRISSWASTGLYYFARGCDFVMHANAMIAADDRERGEFYVAPLYNRLIRAGGDVRIDVADEVWPLGTPEDLATFEARFPRNEP